MRIRTIKPEFWASESLGRLTRDERLVFIGLWSLADDYGRFRADPRFIAGQVFPYDNDGLKVVSRALASLREEGCLVLFEADRSQYGAITGWDRHQKIDRPSQSKLPTPPGGGVGGGSESGPQASTSQAIDLSLANIREPSSSPREASCEEQGTGNREQGREQGAGSVGRGPLGGSETFTLLTHKPPDPVAELRAAWNESTTPPIPRWESGRDTEAKKALRRRPLEQWREVFVRINTSSFCRGDDGGWVASVDWALRGAGKKPETALKVLEGAFDNRAPVRDLTRGVAPPSTGHVVGFFTPPPRKAVP